METRDRLDQDLAAKWNAAESGEAYQTSRFRSERKRQRDVRLLNQLVQRHDPGTRWSQVLDAPCGSGRLAGYLQGRSDRAIALDVSPAMLAEHPGPGRIVGSALELPFADRTFDAVVCCRLLHHLVGSGDRRDLLAELLRVARERVYLSFWDAATWHAWRRRRGWRTVANGDGRLAIRRADLRTLVEQQGGQVLGYAHSMRGISQQAWVALRAPGAR